MTPSRHLALTTLLSRAAGEETAPAAAPPGFVLVPTSVYQAPLDKAIKALAKPPTRRTSATRLRKTPSLQLPEPMYVQELAV